MQITKLTLRKYMRQIARIHKQLGDKRQMEELLDGAREDTPIVEEVLCALAGIQASESEQEDDLEAARSAAMRDLICFLALRAMDRERPQRKPDTAYPGLDSRLLNN